MGDYLNERDLRSSDPTRRLHGDSFVVASSANIHRRTLIALSVAAVAILVLALAWLSGLLS